jgi:hypothetical protein
VNANEVQEIFDWMHLYLPNYDVDESGDITGKLGKFDLKAMALDGDAAGAEGVFILLLKAIPTRMKPITVDHELAIALNTIKRKYAEVPSLTVEVVPTDERMETANFVFSWGYLKIDPKDILRAINDLIDLTEQENAMYSLMDELRARILESPSEDDFSGF